MTWSARIEDAKNPSLEGWHVCPKCQHDQTCQIPKLVSSLGSALTSIDTGCDNHMASGTARLMCNGYELKGETK